MQEPSSTIDWSAVHLLVAVPTKRGIMPECVGSLISILSAVQSKGGKCNFTSSRAPLMCLARGQGMMEPFRPERGENITHLLCMDDDIAIAGDDAVRLIECDMDMVGAAYRIKHQDGKIQFVALCSPEQVDQEPVRGTIALQRIGGGLILYKRHVLQQLLIKYGACAWGGVRALNAPIEYVDDSGEFLTEDYATCDRWRRLGGEVRLLLDVTVAHYDAFGGAHTGNFKGMWEQRHKLLPAKLEAYNTMAGTTTPPTSDAVDTADSADASGHAPMTIPAPAPVSAVSAEAP
jgi:hypothetical protein